MSLHLEELRTSCLGHGPQPPGAQEGPNTSRCPSLMFSDPTLSRSFQAPKPTSASSTAPCFPGKVDSSTLPLSASKFLQNCLLVLWSLPASSQGEVPPCRPLPMAAPGSWNWGFTASRSQTCTYIDRGHLGNWKNSISQVPSDSLRAGSGILTLEHRTG